MLGLELCWGWVEIGLRLQLGSGFGLDGLEGFELGVGLRVEWSGDSPWHKATLPSNRK